MEPEDCACIIEDAANAEPCGKEAYTHLTNAYTFDSGENFEFTLAICKDHQEALIERYRTEFSALAN